MFYRHQCGYGPDDHYENPKHGISMKCIVQPHFPSNSCTYGQGYGAILLPSWSWIHGLHVTICYTNVPSS